MLIHIHSNVIDEHGQRESERNGGGKQENSNEKNLGHQRRSSQFRNKRREKETLITLESITGVELIIFDIIIHFNCIFSDSCFASICRCGQRFIHIERSDIARVITWDCHLLWIQPWLVRWIILRFPLIVFRAGFS